MTWLDIEKIQLLEDREGNPIPQVPSTTKPEAKVINFVFIPSCHRLFFDAKSIKPSSMRTLIDGLFNHKQMITKYGRIEVTVEQSSEGLDKIVKMYKISELTITISKPNPDDLFSYGAAVMKRLENSNADKVTDILTGSSGITPDKDTQDLMRVSLSNGSTSAKGKDSDGRKIEESTEEHPLIKQYEYKSDEGFINAFIRKTHEMAAIILNRN